METILPQPLLREVLDYYESKKDSGYVVNPSIPVLYFGDLERYFKNSYKVITVGKNPSFNEFKGGIENRFNKFRNSPYSLEYVLNKYFRENPYKSWFNNYERFLNGLGYTYYPNNGKKKVIHTDICSPLTTKKSWSVFKNNYPEEVDEIIDYGFNLWKRLILKLKPNLIVFSIPVYDELKNFLFEELKVEKVRTIHRITEKDDGSKRGEPFELTLNKIDVNGNNFSMINGGRSLNNPFGGVLKPDVIRWVN